MDLILSLIVVIIALGLLYWAAHRLASAFGLAPPIVAVLDVLLVIIAVLLLLRLFGLGSRLGLGV